MKTKKAVVGTAKKNELHHKVYTKPIMLSSLKILIGEILLFGNKQRKEVWVLFEVLLTQYVQSLTEHPSELLKSKNSAEG